MEQENEKLCGRGLTRNEKKMSWKRKSREDIVRWG